MSIGEIFFLTINLLGFSFFLFAWFIKAIYLPFQVSKKNNTPFRIGVLNSSAIEKFNAMEKKLHKLSKISIFTTFIIFIIGNSIFAYAWFNGYFK